MKKPAVVVVTGASAGVGRAAARVFAERGARVGLLARGRDGLEMAAKEVEAAGTQALPVPTDVADPGAVETAAQEIERDLGAIDVWVNNAMTSVFAPFVEVEVDEFRRVNEATFLGYVHGTRAALKRMLPRDRGVIVRVGSALAYRAIPLQSSYCAAKHAIKGFTQSVRTELLHDRSNVKLTMVQMPALNTPQFDWVLSRLPNRAQRSRRSTSPRSRHGRSSTPRSTRDGKYGSGERPLRRSSPTNSFQGCSTTTSGARGSTASRRKSRPTKSALSTYGIPCLATVARTDGSTTVPMRAAPRCGQRRTAGWQPPASLSSLRAGSLGC